MSVVVAGANSNATHIGDVRATRKRPLKDTPMPRPLAPIKREGELAFPKTSRDSPSRCKGEGLGWG